MNIKRILSAILATVMLLGASIIGVNAKAPLPFTDVPEGEWYYDAVAYTYAAGLMNGTGNGSTFSPMVNLTRGMVVTVLYRNDGAPDVRVSNPFDDVNDDAWYAVAATWAYSAGVVTGTGEDEWGDPLFSPDRNITRQELAAMFARYAAYKHVDTASNTADITSFPDSGDVASWAEKEFKWTAGTGIITGKQNGGATKLAPTDLATRAEFAIMIQRYNLKDDAREFTYFLAYETPVLKSQYTEPEYPLVKDADLYVAVDGNNNNPGTFEKPLADLAGAKAKVQELIKSGTKGEIVVAFMGGDYGTIDNLQFTSEDSGSDDVRITYCAYGDSDVYFTNGIFINAGDFAPLDEDEKYMFNADETDNIKKVDLSAHPAASDVTAFTSLSNESGFCWQARTPNKIKGIDQYYNGCTVNVVTPDSPYTLEEIQAEATKNGYLNEHTIIRPYTEQKKLQAIRSLKPRMDAYHTYDNVQVCGYVSKVWHSDALNIIAYDKSTGVMTFSNAPQYDFVNVDTVQQAIINNVSEELDDKGEYWIDAENKVLYVYKPEGSYSMATKDTFLTIPRDVNNITFKKLNFRICNGIGIRSDGDNFTMDMCSLTYVGGVYGLFTNDSINVTITNSTFAYCAETAVSIEGPAPGDRTDYDYNMLEGSGLVFKNNLIHDVDLVRVPVESGGLSISWQVAADVSHNEIYNSARYGIDYKYGNIDCIFEYNYLHHCMQNSADGGAFYCGRVAINRGNILRYNVVADIYALNAMHTGGTYAIYLDDSMENLICYGNVFYNAGTIMNNGGRSHEIYDNVFIGENSGIAGRTGNFADIRMYADSKADDHYYNEGWNRLDRIPDENTPAGQIWKAKWPELYDIVAIRKDPSCYMETDLYNAPMNYCHNNYHFDGAVSDFSDEWVKLSDHENNLEFSADENPIFTDPTHGDYSIADTSKFADNHFDKIGRY